MQIHTVKKGDSLWKIARDYGVPLEPLFVANGLTEQSTLVIGQAIIVPTESRPTVHKVLFGESLWKIGQRYGITIGELTAANGIRNPALIYPGQLLQIPAPSKPVIEVNAYIERLGQRGGELAEQVGDYLTYLSPFSYRILPSGALQPIDDSAAIAAAYEKRAVPMMVITNFEGDNFSPDIAHAVVADPAVQNQTIMNIVSVMAQRGYMALNVDLEYVPPADTKLYNAFLQRLVDTLRPLGYLVSSALAPKVSAAQSGTLYEAHDYEAHGRILDFVILMTYEWGWSGGPPRAVAPLNEVMKVVNYALSVIPANKIIMGIPLYGYDWTLPYVSGGRWAPSLSSQAAVERAAQYGAVIQYDEESQSPFFHYFDQEGKEHVVWFEDARSIQAKLDAVKRLKLRGVSYWVLGVAFAQNWFALGENFTIKKYLR